MIQTMISDCLLIRSAGQQSKLPREISILTISFSYMEKLGLR